MFKVFIEDVTIFLLFSVFSSSMWDLLSPKEKILLLRKDNDGEFWYMMQGLRTHVAYIRTSIRQTFMGCLIYARQRRQWHPTPVLLPGKSHGRGSLVGCSPWGRE